MRDEVRAVRSRDGVRVCDREGQNGNRVSAGRNEGRGNAGRNENRVICDQKEARSVGSAPGRKLVACK